MRQTNHALTFLQAHYRALWLRALRSSRAWVVTGLALSSALALAMPQVAPPDAAQQVESGPAAPFIRVAPGTPIVHVPQVQAAPVPKGQVPAPRAAGKFFDLAQDGSLFGCDAELNSNRVAPSALPQDDSVFAQWNLAEPRPVSDATGGRTTVTIGADGTITLGEGANALLTLRPYTAQEHHYRLVLGSYALEVQPDTTVELLSGSSLSIDGVADAISIDADGALALNESALAAYDLSLSEDSSNLIVDVSALGELASPSLLKLGPTTPNWEPRPNVAPTSVHDYQFPQHEVVVSDLLAASEPRNSQAFGQMAAERAADKLSFAQAADLSHGLTVAPLPGMAERTQLQAQDQALTSPLVLSSNVQRPETSAVLDLGSLSTPPQGPAEAFAVDLIMGGGTTLVLTDQARPKLAAAPSASVFAPHDAPQRIDLAVDAQQETQLALTYRSAQPVAQPDDTVKFVLARSTPVMLDMSALGEGTIAISQDATRLAVVLSRDDKTGLLAINGADIALPLQGSGRVAVSDLLEARAGGMASTALNTAEQVLTGVSAADELAGEWQALEAEPNTTQVKVGAGQTLALQGTLPQAESAVESAESAAERLAPLAATSAGQMVGIELGAGSALQLQSSGKIGSLTGKGTVNLNGVEVMVVSPEDDTPAAVDVEAIKLKRSELKAKELKVKQFESLNSALHLESLQVSDEGSFSAQGSQLKLKSLDLSRVKGMADLAASQVEVGTVRAHQMALHQGTSVYADTIKLSGINSVLAVGHNPSAAPQTERTEQPQSVAPVGSNLVDTSSVGTNLVSTNSVGTNPVVTNIVTRDLDLQGGLLWLAAPDGERASVQTSHLGAASTLKLSGNVVVGANAAFGVTSERSAFAAAQERSRQSYGLSSLAYIDRAGLEVGPHKLIVGPENQAVLSRELKGSNSVYLGARGGLQVTARALGEAAAQGSSVITGMAGKTVASNSGYLLVPALTSSAELGTIFGSAVKLKEGDRINVATENGLYRGIITTSAQLQGKASLNLKLAPNSREILRKLSDPTYDALMNIMSPESAFIGTYERTSQSLDSLVSDFNDSTGGDSTVGDSIITGEPNGSVDGGLTNNGTPSNDANSLPSNGLAGGNNGANVITDDTTSGSLDGNLTADTSLDLGTDNGLGETTASDSLTGSTSEGGSATGGSGSGTLSNNIAGTLRPSNGVTVKTAAAGFKFLRDAIGSHNYEAIDQVARMANFGGAVQGVQLVSASSVDAMNLRLGFGKGANMELTSGIARASSLEHNSLWLNPIYRSYKAKDFDAQGREYGSDIELYGAILGLDHYEDGASELLSGSGLAGLRVGAMFSVGEGDAQGKNAGQGISNDMSFYSLGLFAGLDLGRDVKLVADISYAEVDNDLSAWTGVADWNLMTSNTDSSNLNIGVGAQVTVRAPKTQVEISPHLSLRYHHVAIDDYDVAIDGTTVAANSMQSMDMWSLPLGVSFARDFSTAQWMVRPAFDLTISANFGDTDMNSRTRFDGVTGADFNYCTQVIDSFTYSVTTGLALKHQSGKFAALVNFGYNGSLHADDYMVNAQLNYLF